MTSSLADTYFIYQNWHCITQSDLLIARTACPLPDGWQPPSHFSIPDIYAATKVELKRRATLHLAMLEGPLDIPKRDPWMVYNKMLAEHEGKTFITKAEFDKLSADDLVRLKQDDARTWQEIATAMLIRIKGQNEVINDLIDSLINQ